MAAAAGKGESARRAERGPGARARAAAILPRTRTTNGTSPRVKAVPIPSAPRGRVAVATTGRREPTAGRVQETRGLGRPRQTVGQGARRGAVTRARLTRARPSARRRRRRRPRRAGMDTPSAPVGRSRTAVRRTAVRCRRATVTAARAARPARTAARTNAMTRVVAAPEPRARLFLLRALLVTRPPEPWRSKTSRQKENV